MLRKHSRTIRCQQPKALKSVNYRHGWHSDATEHILWNFHPFIATSEKGPCFFFPKFVWMIRLDIFWSWGHPWVGKDDPSVSFLSYQLVRHRSLLPQTYILNPPKSWIYQYLGEKYVTSIFCMYTNISNDTNISVIYVYKYTYGTHERAIQIYQFRYAYNTFSGTLLKYLTSLDITWQAVALAAVRQNGLALQCLDETSLSSTRSQMFPIGLYNILYKYYAFIISKSRWFCSFYSENLGDDPIWEAIVVNGCFNHQVYR